MENNFCPFGSCICTGKTVADFSFMLSAIQKTLNNLKENYSISMLVTKNNKAVLEVFKVVFGTNSIQFPIKHSICNTHVLNNVYKNIEK